MQSRMFRNFVLENCPYAHRRSDRASLPTSSIDAHTHIAHSIVRYLGVSSPAELAPFGINSSGDLVDLISRVSSQLEYVAYANSSLQFTTNTFALTSAALDPIGVCVSPTLALANHSCVPNAVVVFPRTSASPSQKEPGAHLICIREIKEGEQVMNLDAVSSGPDLISDSQIWVSYIDTTLPYTERQKILQETYNFTCKCPLCTQRTDVDPRESVWCPKTCGGTCPQPSDGKISFHTRIREFLTLSTLRSRCSEVHRMQGHYTIPRCNCGCC